MGRGLKALPEVGKEVNFQVHLPGKMSADGSFAGNRCTFLERFCVFDKLLLPSKGYVAYALRGNANFHIISMKVKGGRYAPQLSYSVFQLR